MLRQLGPGEVRDGVHFSATAASPSEEGHPLFHFCRRTDRVLITFSETEMGLSQGTA
jgi:hypothetical protein